MEKANEIFYLACRRPWDILLVTRAETRGHRNLRWKIFLPKQRAEGSFGPLVRTFLAAESGDSRPIGIRCLGPVVTPDVSVRFQIVNPAHRAAFVLGQHNAKVGILAGAGGFGKELGSEREFCGCFHALVYPIGYTRAREI